VNNRHPAMAAAHKGVVLLLFLFIDVPFFARLASVRTTFDRIELAVNARKLSTFSIQGR
jgi:hypothetical protein